MALNKSDINEKQNTKIDTETLSKKLNCPVIRTISTSSGSDNGLKEVVKSAVELSGRKQKAPYLQAEINLHDKKL